MWCQSFVKLSRGGDRSTLIIPLDLHSNLARKEFASFLDSKPVSPGGKRSPGVGRKGNATPCFPHGFIQNLFNFLRNNLSEKQKDRCFLTDPYCHKPWDRGEENGNVFTCPRMSGVVALSPAPAHSPPHPKAQDNLRCFGVCTWH